MWISTHAHDYIIDKLTLRELLNKHYQAISTETIYEKHYEWHIECNIENDMRLNWMETINSETTQQVKDLVNPPFL